MTSLHTNPALFKIFEKIEAFKESESKRAMDLLESSDYDRPAYLDAEDGERIRYRQDVLIELLLEELGLSHSQIKGNTLNTECS